MFVLGKMTFALNAHYRNNAFRVNVPLGRVKRLENETATGLLDGSTGF